MTNVLITSAGRRTSLVRAFQQIGSGRVVAADVDALAPALAFADETVRVPPVGTDEYVDRLLSIVAEHDIKLVIPTIDPELSVLAEHREKLEAAGPTVVISSAELIANTGDKYLAARFFAGEGLATPATWLPDELPPDAPDELFVKPRLGSASAGCHPVTKADLDGVLATVTSPVIQPRLRGEEITVDALFDFSGTLLHSVPRRRIKTLGGESIQGVTLPYADYGPWIEQVGEVLGRCGAAGPVTFQGFPDDGRLLLTEVNPRFGGGVPLTIAAGGNYPAWLVQLANGDVPDPSGYLEGLYMTRHMEEIFMTELRW